jgi:hypothetical protein
MARVLHAPRYRVERTDRSEYAHKRNPDGSVGAAHNAPAAILEATSRCETLLGLTQFAAASPVVSWKLLILNGEMAEWLKEHPWKMILANRIKQHDHSDQQLTSRQCCWM